MKSSATPFERERERERADCQELARRRSSLRLARRRPKTFNQIDRQVADQFMSRVSPASFDSLLLLLPPLPTTSWGCCCHNTTTTTMGLPHPYLAAPSLSIRLSFISQRDGKRRTDGEMMDEREIKGLYKNSIVAAQTIKWEEAQRKYI